MKKTKYLRLFHISRQNLDGVTLYPRIPDNRLTQKGKENATVPRVCMSPFIEGCLRSITTTPACLSFNIYTTLDLVEEQYQPTEVEVMDAPLTGEIWVLEPVTLVYYGRLDLHARVDVAPCMGYKTKLAELGFTDVALHCYSVYAKSNFYKSEKGSTDIEVIDEEPDDPFVKKLVPEDFDSPTPTTPPSTISLSLATDADLQKPDIYGSLKIQTRKGIQEF